MSLFPWRDQMIAQSDVERGGRTWSRPTPPLIENRNPPPPPSPSPPSGSGALNMMLLHDVRGALLVVADELRHISDRLDRAGL